jgi:hypothetical protein
MGLAAPARLRHPGVLAGGLMLAIVLAYAFDCGRGFVKDDFRWIVESRVSSPQDAARLFSSDNGFYRPMVSLSFAANEQLFGRWPKGYALVNLGVMMLAAAALFLLCRALRMETGAALFAAGLWSMNPHGISGLVMWISGRTSGIVTLLSLLAAWAFVKERRFLAALLAFLALLSKEEAFFLPVVLAVWSGWLSTTCGWDARRAAARTWPVLLAIGPYLLLRAQTHAYLPTTAPSYYRLTLDPTLLGRNLLEYADRSATFTVAVLVVMLLVVRRVRPLETSERRWVAMGLTWAVGGFGLTLFVPSRSSLYVCLPLAGVAIAGAAVARSLWSLTTARMRTGLLVAAAVVPLALVPLHRSRNQRSRRAAELSAMTLEKIDTVWHGSQSTGGLSLVDDPTQRTNLRNAFGTLIAQALLLETGTTRQVLYLPSSDDWTEAQVLTSEGIVDPHALQLRLANDTLTVSAP